LTASFAIFLIDLVSRQRGVFPSAILVGTPHIDSTARHRTVYAPLENPNKKIRSPGFQMLWIAA
jgi:hypothetical protein